MIKSHPMQGKPAPGGFFAAQAEAVLDIFPHFFYKLR